MSKCAVIYTRTALDQPGSTRSTAQQEQACRAYAEGHSWKVIAVYADRGTSGTNGNRPGLQRLLKDVSEGDIHAVLVTTRDRLARSATLWQTITKACERQNTSVIAVEEAPHE